MVQNMVQQLKLSTNAEIALKQTMRIARTQEMHKSPGRDVAIPSVIKIVQRSNSGGGQGTLYSLMAVPEVLAHPGGDHIEAGHSS